MSAPFVMFSTVHIATLCVILALMISLFAFRKKFQFDMQTTRRIERGIALSLIGMEILYHVWMVQSERWRLVDSLPLELCSLSLLITAFLLWTGNKHVVDFVVFAGIGGALQAIVTPVLDMDFPHFRYFHFFYTHAMIILTGLYFIWIKGYRPTFKGVVKTMLVLNVLLPVILLVNKLVEANYMFLRNKPENGSLLDVLGPYPWYILSLEAVAFLIFTLLWLGLRKSTDQFHSECGD